MTSYLTDKNPSLPSTSEIIVPQKRRSSRTVTVTTSKAKSKKKRSSTSPVLSTSPDDPLIPTYSYGESNVGIPSIGAITSSFPTSEVVWSAYVPQPSNQTNGHQLPQNSNYYPEAGYDSTNGAETVATPSKALIGSAKRNEQNRRAQSGYRKRRDE